MRADNRCDMESHPVLETPLKKSLVRAAADAAESRVNIADSKKLRGVLETPARKELMSRAVDMKDERQGKMQTNGKCMPTPLKLSIASTADMRADNRCDMESHPVLETPLKKSLVRAAADAAESRVNIADSKKLRGVLETPARKELMSRAVDFQSSNGKFLSYESHGPLSSLTVSVLKEKCKEVGIKYS